MSKGALKALAGIIFSIPLFLLALPGNNADAFCIYNNNKYSGPESGDIRVVQKSGHKIGRGYTATIRKGDRGCVNWQETSVNTSGERDSILHFDVYYLCSIYEIKVCDNFPIKAGGWMIVERAGRQLNDPGFCESFF